MNARAQQIVTDLQARGYKIHFQPSKDYVLASRAGWLIGIMKATGLQWCIEENDEFENRFEPNQ